MKRLALLLGLVAPGITPAAAQPACPADFQNQAGPMTCACTTEAALSGEVWGTGTYTDDSRICRAAIHAGAMPVTGGIVTVTPAPGLQSYSGSTANGIASADYGPWGGSFTIAPAGLTAQIAAAAACPADFQDRTTPLSCNCSAAATQSGTVWGSGPYTSDSSICRAALHAGIISPAGGAVSVEPAPGEPSYDSSDANGVATAAYGPWSASFTLRRSGLK